MATTHILFHSADADHARDIRDHRSVSSSTGSLCVLNGVVRRCCCCSLFLPGWMELQEAVRPSQRCYSCIPLALTSEIISLSSGVKKTNYQYLPNYPHRIRDVTLRDVQCCHVCWISNRRDIPPPHLHLSIIKRHTIKSPSKSKPLSRLYDNTIHTRHLSRHSPLVYILSWLKPMIKIIYNAWEL
jgi:hypothetical protein